MSSEISKLSVQMSVDPRQKHQTESNESNSFPPDVKTVPKSGKLVVNQKTSIRRNGNHVYGKSFIGIRALISLRKLPDRLTAYD